MKRVADLFRSLLLVVLLVSVGCNEAQKEEKNPLNSYHPKYATGFKIDYFEDYKVLEVKPDQRYYLVNSNRDTEKIIAALKQDNIPNANIVILPIERMACMSETHWAAADLFGKTNTIVGVSDAQYLHDPQIKDRLEKGSLKEIAANQTVFLETLLSAAPQILMVSPSETEDYQNIAKHGIAVLYNGDFLEEHPLGRAEWMVFTAALFDKESEAVVLFDTICQRYNDLVTKSAAEFDKPTIFDGLDYGGVWYVSGGKSYMARFYEDAGAQYLWKEDDHVSSVPLDFETVFQRGLKADYWRIYIREEMTYDQLQQSNRHYGSFTAWKEGRIIYCNTAETPIFSKGIFQPDLILADFIKAFHPDLLPEYVPRYYKILKK